MALSFVAEALRSQASIKEQNKGLQEQFAQELVGRFLAPVAAGNVGRGTRRRGAEAASLSRGADAMQQIDLGKTRLESQQEISTLSENLGFVNAAAASLSALVSYYATTMDDEAKKEAEAAAVKESQAAEEAAMLTDFRKPGEEYSPSMLRIPDDPLVDELIRDEFDPQTTDGYFPRGGQIPQGYRGTGMTATEFKAARDAYRAEKATESLLDELVADEAQESSVKSMDKKMKDYTKNQIRSSLRPGGQKKEEMTNDELADYLFGGAE
tara:strand:+ start:600 stop:1403 length:804 start_codon:yes stop_codon:yes gene_type:complete